MKAPSPQNQLTQPDSEPFVNASAPQLSAPETDATIADSSTCRRILEQQAPFQIEIRFTPLGIAAWIKNLPVHAEGETVDEALNELAVALMDYASTWEKHLRHAPNHKDNVGYVRRVQLAGSVSAVRQMLTSVTTE